MPGNPVIPVRLLPRRRIAGKILDAASRKPLKGALVWAGRPLAAPAAISDAEGAFQLDTPPREELRVEGAALGYLPGARRSFPSGAAEPVLVTLTPAAEISGVVVDTVGRPLATARVAIETQLFEAIGSVRTGPDGRFRLTGLRPGGAYGLAVASEGLKSRRMAVRIAPAGRATPPVRVVLDRGQTVSGRVVGEDGGPIADAHLTLIHPRTSLEVSRTVSDTEGRFELENLEPGQLDLIVAHLGHTPANLPGIVIPAGGPAVDLGTMTMADGVAIEGRVTDTRGVPLARAFVRAKPESSPLLDRLSMHPANYGSREIVQTGPDGGFRLVEGLRQGVTYTLTAGRSGYDSASVSGVQAPTKEPIRIEIKAERALSGRVVGPEGEPVAGASLYRVEESRTVFGKYVDRSLGETDAGGRFRVVDLLPGAATEFVVEAEGYGPRKVSGLRIPEDRGVTDVTIALERAVLLEVRLLNARGEPVVGAWIQAEPEQREPRPGLGTEMGFALENAFIEPVTTDDEGRCQLSVEPGSYQVEASRDDGRTVRRQVVVGSASLPVELRFPAGAQVSGRVLDGAGLGNVSVSIIQDRSTAMRVPTEADGTFRFFGVPEGRYSVTAREGEAESASVPLEVVVAGKPVRNLQLRLKPK